MFKAQIQEAYVLKSLGVKDISGATQSNSKLLDYSKEGILSLGTLAAFQGDNTFKVGTQNLLNFFKMESEQKMPIFIDFYLKQENFEMMKKAMDTKPAKDRTKEDVDNYNKAVTDYNNGIETYSKVNGEVNNSRAKAINDWNNIAAAFMAKHVPNK